MTEPLNLPSFANPWLDLGIKAAALVVIFYKLHRRLIADAIADHDGRLVELEGADELQAQQLQRHNSALARLTRRVTHVERAATRHEEAIDFLRGNHPEPEE
jgi:hypothetical protein